MGSFDVIVIGGGHAGCEAAAASARYGAKTALVTKSRDTIGILSCNPAIGGLGKGHLVREIDALDGVMGRVADIAGIHFRMLNRRKGPAVQGPRAQVDRTIYRQAMGKLLGDIPNLWIIEGDASDVVIRDRAVVGVEINSVRMFTCRSVVLTTGTFLNASIFVGKQCLPGGRIGVSPAKSITGSLIRAGVSFGRLKTGTPPRLDARLIDYSKLEAQHGDSVPELFSTLSRVRVTNQIPCYITRTTVATHRIVQRNLHMTGVYSGAIVGLGPRYCPSVEDKVVRFPERTGHQIFLEPESREQLTVYPNGISTSLPIHAQRRFISTIPGLEHTRIVRPGYAIEYDFADPRQLRRTLMSRFVKGLFLAGQVNGTTGYEEAAAQGLVAGLNAGRFAGEADLVMLGRNESYLGVLIDDLVTQGVSEPYRMFTSRAEFRLSLRWDNAEERLTELGVQWGCVGTQRARQQLERVREVRELRRTLEQLVVTSGRLQAMGIADSQRPGRRTAFELLRQEDCEWDKLVAVWPQLECARESARRHVIFDSKYATYVERQCADIARYRLDENLRIPQGLDFFQIGGLSSEMRDKFSKCPPETIGQASRVQGVTPAALLALAAWVRKSVRC